MKKIEVRQYRGMRDFLPEQMRKREYVFSKIKKVFEAHGFEPLETPAIELWETLAGKYGEEGERLIYRFTDRGGREVGLRYDLTVPLARVVAQYQNQIIFPFKRYQMQPVWRADRPQKGRFREFYQCDVDIVGSKDMIADAEVLTVIYEALKDLGFKNFTIRVNNRKLLRSLALKVEAAEKEFDIARAIDKLDKKGKEGVKEELEKTGLEPDKIDFVLKIIDARQLDEVASLLEGVEGTEEGIEELRELFNLTESYGIPPSFISFDMSLARGLDYYTGPIFETVVKEPRIGSITGGGRYDNLIGIFAGRQIPATGTSLGVERIITVMDELNMFPSSIGQKTQALVAHFRDTVEEAFKIASMLRKEAITAEVFPAVKSLRAQLGYASDKGIPFVVIAGEELKEGKVAIKNLRTGHQELVPLDQLSQYLKKNTLQR